MKKRTKKLCKNAITLQFQQVIVLPNMPMTAAPEKETLQMLVSRNFLYKKAEYLRILMKNRILECNVCSYVLDPKKFMGFIHDMSGACCDRSK
jgi:hypothetical protein